ncbi:MAG: T9SS type A sorting domain-containing protein, partial [Rhodothermales bacterium]|nr:T9SS type A sorting domain-containing protein [Rhodothermales bacterium]
TEFVDSTGDVDSLLAGAQDLTGAAYTEIVGEFSTVSDIDLYKINIVSADSFAATTEINFGTHLDTELWLFDSNGLGVYFNDDSPNRATDMSLLPRPQGGLGPQAPGVYYLGVGVYELNALDEDGAEIFENPRNFNSVWDRLNAPLSNKPLASWRVFGTGGNPPGTYRVTMTGTGGEFFNIANETDTVLPEGFTMERAYPNPFSGVVSFDFAVAQAQFVRATVFNALGQAVQEAYSGFVTPANQQTVRIDGSGLPNGTYFIRVQGDGFHSTQTVTLQR